LPSDKDMKTGGRGLCKNTPCIHLGKKRNPYSGQSVAILICSADLHLLQKQIHYHKLHRIRKCFPFYFIKYSLHR